MTENKPIMIDKVDVSKCECCSQINLDMNMICISSFPSKKSGYCKDNPNCLFKQLKRIEQKLEQIKEVIEEYCEQMCLCDSRETCKDCINTEILQIIKEET